MSRKINTTVYFDEEQLERLKLFSEAKQRPMAELIRLSVDILMDESPQIEPALELAKTMYPGMTESGLRVRIIQDWLHDRMSGGKRKVLDEVKEGNNRIEERVTILETEVKTILDILRNHFDA